MTQRDPLYDKHVLVIGFARQGQALARWLPTVDARVTVHDRKSLDEIGIEPETMPRVRFKMGSVDEDILTGVDLVCVSGGVPLAHPIIEAAKAAGIPLSNDAQIFMERSPAPVVGITGSAGKTTTTSLVGEIITAAGYRTHVGGNIGDVLLDSLADMTPDDVVVMELSSFQLELMTSSPQLAAVLNITPNHLDRHGTMAEYIGAKANIVRHQRSSDMTVLNADDPNSRAFEMIAPGELAMFSLYDIVPDGAFMMGERVTLAGAASYDYVPHVVMERDEIPLRGEHNVANVLAAVAIAGSLGLAIDRPGIPVEVIADTVRNFKPVTHRLEVICQKDGVTWINDSIATAPERLIAALRSFKEPLVLLIGGADKKLPWDDAISLAMQKAHHVIVFGKDGDKQVANVVMPLLRLRGANDEYVSRVETLEEAVARAAEVAREGDTVLLSPGGTSYDAYQDFAARGDHFRRLVNQL